MKTTVELPDKVFRRAKTYAAAEGLSLKQLFTEALEARLRAGSGASSSGEPPWMKGFGALSGLRQESAEVMRVVAEEFERLEPEDLA